jgi:hypothetical protein
MIGYRNRDLLAFSAVPQQLRHQQRFSQKKRKADKTANKQ